MALKYFSWGTTHGAYFPFDQQQVIYNEINKQESLLFVISISGNQIVNSKFNSKRDKTSKMLV